jgi:hypothetical protein
VAPEALELASVARAAVTVETNSRRSSRLPNPSKRYEDKVLLLYNDEPATYKEAMMGPNSTKWLSTIKYEI